MSSRCPLSHLPSASEESEEEEEEEEEEEAR